MALSIVLSAGQTVYLLSVKDVTDVVVVGRNFKDDPDCARHLPVANDGANLYEKCKDGILLWSVSSLID